MVTTLGLLPPMYGGMGNGVKSQRGHQLVGYLRPLTSVISHTKEPTRRSKRTLTGMRFLSLEIQMCISSLLLKARPTSVTGENL